jgi:hypothetical protein
MTGIVRLWIVSGVALVFALAVAPASADLLLLEDFNYPDGNFNGTQNGGTASGGAAWTSAWTLAPGSQTSGGIDAWRVLAGKANAPGNELTGNAARQNGDIVRNFSTGAAPNTTLYFGFDMERVNDAEGAYETTLQFHGGAVEVGIRSDAVTARLGGTTQTAANPPAAFDDQFIARVIFDPLGVETLTVWRDATSELDAPLFNFTAELGQVDLGNLVTLNKLNQDNNQFNIDNFRIGTDFAFTPVVVPEPASIALWLLLGAAGLGFVITRHKQARR